MLLRNIFSKKTNIITDPARVDAFLNRGLEAVYPNKDFLRARMLRGEQQTIYLGIDPTGPSLHLGTAVILIKMREFQALGHKVIMLIGDFTGMIGDPTDKSATRKKLTREQVLANARVYKEQASTFLTFSGSNAAELKYNSTWLNAMNFGDVLELASHITVEQMLKRDMFEKRMQENKPIFIHEFLYPLLQGYDSVAMDVDGEIGGNDQTFNMLVGRDLLKSLKNKEKFVITCKLLTDPSGKKMGKTEGNMVSMDQTASDMFGRVMSWTDGLILPAFELVTLVPTSQIEEYKKRLDQGENPKNIKIELAKAIVSIYHGADAADAAHAGFEQTFTKGGIPSDTPTVTAAAGDMLGDVLVRANIVDSKTDWKRLVADGAVTNTESDQKITDPTTTVSGPATLKIGKKRFVHIKL